MGSTTSVQKITKKDVILSTIRDYLEMGKCDMVEKARVRFGFSLDLVKAEAIVCYTRQKRLDTYESDLIAARIAKQYLPPQLVTMALERPLRDFLLDTTTSKNYEAHADISMEFRDFILPGQFKGAMERVLVESLLKDKDKKSTGRRSSKEELIKKYGIEQDIVVSAAVIVYKRYCDKKDYLYAAKIAKDNGFPEGLQRSIAEKAFNDPNIDLPARLRLTEDYNLGPEVSFQTARMYLQSIIPTLPNKEIAENLALRHGISEIELRNIVLATFEDEKRQGHNRSALAIMNLFKVEIPEEERKALARLCYNDDITIPERYERAALTAISEELEHDLAINAVKLLVGKSATFAPDSAVCQITYYINKLKKAGYEDEELQELQPLADAVKVALFKSQLALISSNRVLDQLQQDVGAYSIGKEQQTQWSNEVLISGLNSERPNYENLFMIASIFEISKNNIEALVEKSYSHQNINYSSSIDELISKKKITPEKLREIQDRVLDSRLQNSGVYNYDHSVEFVKMILRT
jgi:hypothetical protein